jgi:signal transduction histidine kinase
MDAALELAVEQAAIGVGEVDGRLAFLAGAQNPAALRDLNDDFIVYLLDADGAVLDLLSNEDDIPDFAGTTAVEQTVYDAGEPWRLVRRPVTVDGRAGWLQAVQEMEPVLDTLADLRGQLLWGLPLALLLAGAGGYFLASRALQPIDRITQTAQAISGSDLSRRIAYRGPADEVGRLAQTFDAMLDRLQAAFARERRFTGDAAHELRTPLTALKGRIEVALSRPRPAGEYAETLAELQGQVDRLIRLSGDLLFMARLDQNGRRREAERIELADFLGAVVDQIRPLAAAKQITLVEEVPAGLEIQGDLDLVIRLFLNLLDNGVKYSPAGGEVLVEGMAVAGMAQITIRDHGPGIPADHLPHLFERFYRVEGDRARRGDGRPSGRAARAAPGSAWRSPPKSPAPTTGRSASPARSARERLFRLYCLCMQDDFS